MIAAAAVAEFAIESTTGSRIFLLKRKQIKFQTHSKGHSSSSNEWRSNITDSATSISTK